MSHQPQPFFANETAQEHLAAIIESSDDAIISKDLNGIIQSWNRSAERIFGYTAEEALGRHISMLAVPETIHEFPAILERIARGERIDHFETRRKTKDGRVLSISLSVSPIRDATGKILGASKIARDITYQKHYAELQAHLAAIIESSDDAIISKDLNGTIQSWNSGAERIFGYTAAEAVGNHIAMLAAPGVADEIPGILNRIAHGERIDHYRTRRRTKDGRILSVSLTVSPIRNANGTIIGASKIARDITEQEGFQQALREANDLLVRSSADLEQFTYAASHDLQEPLRIVSLFSQMLQHKFGGVLGESGSEYLSYIVAGTARMERLLRDLQVFTQASVLNHEPVPEVDSDEVLNRSLANLAGEMESSDTSITRGELPSVRIHEFQLERLFQYLIANAIRYRSADRPRIHVDAERCGDFWRFSIRDNGIGIERQYQEKIFGIFKRLHTDAEYPGTGMGLAICQKIVERAGGQMRVESELGQGATFLFTLPAGQGNSRSGLIEAASGFPISSR